MGRPPLQTEFTEQPDRRLVTTTPLTHAGKGRPGATMNIFFLDRNPVAAARMHCDKHVGKMLVEAAQMMSTGLALAGHPVGYRPAYANHPMTIWVRRSAVNFAWTWSLASELGREYRFRFGRSHRSASLLPALLTAVDWSAVFGAQGLTPPPLCMPDAYRRADDPVGAYRAFYRGEKSRFARYTRRPAPPFMTT